MRGYWGLAPLLHGAVQAPLSEYAPVYCNFHFKETKRRIGNVLNVYVVVFSFILGKHICSGVLFHPR